jgi:hypothetical protein
VPATIITSLVVCLLVVTSCAPGSIETRPPGNDSIAPAVDAGASPSPVASDSGSPLAPDTSPAQPPGDKPLTIDQFCQQVGVVGCCDQTSGAVWCENGVPYYLECPGQCGWNAGGYYDCNQSGADPTGKFPETCPKLADPGSCESNCQPGACGMVDNCGKTCGCTSAETCESGSCVPKTTQPPASCTSGKKQCSGNDLQECVSGSWIKTETCANGCLSGICLGGSCDCQISASSVKVTFPYVSTSPATVVSATGSCYVGTSAKPCGYKGVELFKVVSYKGGSVSIKDLYTGGYVWGISFPFTQQAPTSSEASTLASKTGVSSSALKAASAATVTTGISEKPTLSGYTLPDGVSLKAFFPTASGQDASIYFSSSDKSALEPVLDELEKSSGISVKLKLLPQLGMSQKTYTYEFKLKKTGATITSITP